MNRPLPEYFNPTPICPVLLSNKKEGKKESQARKETEEKKDTKIGRLTDKRHMCPSAEERSDVSTRAQCRGQGATPPPAVSVAEPGDVHVDLNTSSE